MSQNTELISLGPKLPAFVSQPHTAAGPGEAPWEHQALGATLTCAPPLLHPAVSELRFLWLLARGPGLLPEQGRIGSVWPPASGGVNSLVSKAGRAG